MVNYNPFSLRGKTILITGASSGIGRTTAIECSKMGASVIITGRDEERLNDTFNSLISNSTAHLKIIADLTKEEDLESLVQKLPILDGCVNNAGVVGLVPTSFLSIDKITKMQQINLNVPMMLTKLLVKKKKLKNPSSIVFTSSVAGVFRVSMGNAIYATTKCGIDAFMRTAALELAAKGIRCNSVNPAMVETRILNRGQLTPEQYELDRQRYPLKRYGNPEDVAWGIIYLLSDASSWVTGTALKLDGGMTLE
ncbi:MAG: SDR family oxidoreductase [Mediterranea massiliensis]|nr:SDR family oxidoreductase [Mediterranea massiliensis]